MGITFVSKLFSNSPAALTLVKHNPFPSTPPNFIRIEKWLYHFTTPEERAETGHYWKRDNRSLYASPIHRDNPQFKQWLQTQNLPPIVPHGSQAPKIHFLHYIPVARITQTIFIM